MKKNILILAALIAVVLAVPFLIIKADEAIQIKNAEFKEKQMQSFAKLFRTKKELRSCINSYGIFRKRISTVVNMQKK